MSFRDRLQQIAADKTWVEFSQKIGSNTNTVGLWDDEHLPSGKKLKAICAAYGVNLHWLLTGEGEPFPGDSQPSQTPAGAEQKPLAAPHGVAYSYLVARAPIQAAPAADEPRILQVMEHAPGTCDPSEFDLVPMSEAQLSAGGGAFVISENIKTYYAFRKDWIRRIAVSPRKLIMMEIKGGSMDPTICTGDVVLIDLGRTHIHSGQIYALRINDTIMIKRLEPLVGGMIRVISDNRAEYPPYDVFRNDLCVIGQVIWYARELVQRE